MKKFLTTSFILLALTFGTVCTFASSAQAVEPLLPLPGDPAGGGIPTITPGPSEPISLPNSPSAVSATPAPTDKAAAESVVPLSTDGSEGFGPVMLFIMGLFAWLVGVAAVTLDYAVYFTVIRMGEYVNSLAAIGVSWRILRDIANIMLIFGFIGAGIATILNIDQYGWKTKMLPMLLVGAIFLNFSLFTSEALIDTTNLFATQFYKQINGGQLPTAQSLHDVTFKTEGISNAIMNSLGLQSIYGDVRNTDKAAKILKAGNSWVIGWMGVLLFSITAFVMFSLAFILIARFVVLIFLIVVSPVAFMGLAIPQMKYRAGQWWKHFFEQIITAPVLLLLLYVALAVITDAQFLTGFSDHPQWTGLFDTANGSMNIGSFAGMMLSFLVAMGLLLVVVIKAKSMSAAGASTAIKWGGRLAFGAPALGASAITGGLSRLTRYVVQRANPTSAFGRGAQRTASRMLRAAEAGRMDLRSIPGVSSGLKLANLGEASDKIKSSAAVRAHEGLEWVRHGGDAANAKMAQETRLPRLRNAIATGNRATAIQLMRTVTDDELRRRDIQELIRNNPLAVQVLTNHQVSILPDETLTSAGVYGNLSAIQLEAYRAAGNGAPRNPAMEAYFTANQYNGAYLGFRNAADQAAIRTFWNI